MILNKERVDCALTVQCSKNPKVKDPLAEGEVGPGVPAGYGAGL